MRIFTVKIKYQLVLSVLSLSLIFSSYYSSGQEEPLRVRLASIPGITYKAVECDTFFTEKYEIFIDQPVDHKDPSKGTFKQRFVLAHKGFDKPVVFVTEGYGGAYALRPRYIDELCVPLQANLVCVEHRYFGTSVPDPLDWKYLTIENAADDHHRIIELLKQIYRGKWISTGISKGGQTAMYHRYFFPDDVDATIGYVCPLNFSTEDLRVYDFLNQVGNVFCRMRIRNFQEMMLRRKAECLPVFEKMASDKKLHFSIGIEKAYELMAMEYSFAFWQWGYFDCGQIPTIDATPEQIIKHLDAVAGLDWVSDEGIRDMQPFFYQALTETGMYGYKISDFGNLITALKSGTFDFTCPKGVQCIFNPVPMQNVDCFIRHHAEHMLFIYGETDAWSSTAVQLTGRPGTVKIINPNGSHRTRISNLPEDLRKKVYSTLEEWLKIEIN